MVAGRMFRGYPTEDEYGGVEKKDKGGIAPFIKNSAKSY